MGGTSLIPGIKIKQEKPRLQNVNGAFLISNIKDTFYFTTLFVAGSGKITAGLNDLASSKSINA